MPPAATVGAALAATFARRGEARGLWFEGRWLSFRDLGERASRVAAGLQAEGIVAGDRVAVGLPNSADLVFAVAGVLQAGAILVPLNPAYTADELRYVLADSGAARAIVSHNHAEILAEAAPAPLRRFSTLLPDHPGVISAGSPATDADDPALIVYTSGTTGRPKGAVLSHRALLTNFTTVASLWDWREDDRLLLTLPCFHLHGLGLGILTSLIVGSSIILRTRFELDRVLPDIVEHEATMFFGVPTIYNRLVTLPDESVAASDLGRMRLWVSGSAPLNPVTYDRFRTRFGFSLMDRYGMTECCFALSTRLDENRRAGVLGRALPGVEVRLVDSDRCAAGELVDVPDGVEGEILIKGPNLFSGYWQRPQETAAALRDGYLCSGDIAVREADGQIRILGRKSLDIIKTRGFKVGAGEVEEVLLGHPAVREVAVVGLADSDQGQRIVAVVVRDGEIDANDLLAHARRQLAPHKVPAAIVFLDDLPKTGPGKIKKSELLRQLE